MDEIKLLKCVRHLPYCSRLPGTACGLAMWVLSLLGLCGQSRPGLPQGLAPPPPCMEREDLKEQAEGGERGCGFFFKQDPAGAGQWD